MKTLHLDLLHSLRTLRKNPGYASVAILLFALGIGANTAIFSVSSYGEIEHAVESPEVQRYPAQQGLFLQPIFFLVARADAIETKLPPGQRRSVTTS